MLGAEEDLQDARLSAGRPTAMVWSSSLRGDGEEHVGRDVLWMIIDPVGLIVGDHDQASATINLLAFHGPQDMAGTGIDYSIP